MKKRMIFGLFITCMSFTSAHADTWYKYISTTCDTDNSQLIIEKHVSMNQPLTEKRGDKMWTLDDLYDRDASLMTAPVTDVRTIAIDCKLSQSNTMQHYHIRLGAEIGNGSVQGMCGAFDDFWVTVTSNKETILPKLIFDDSCHHPQAAITKKVVIRPTYDGSEVDKTITNMVYYQVRDEPSKHKLPDNNSADATIKAVAEATTE